MNVSALAQSAYGQSSGGARTARETEYAVFARVTGALSAARDSGSFPRLAEALHLNIRMWGVLANDVAAPNNALPQDLRARIAGLAVFSIRASLAAIEGEGEVEPIIDLNQTIMKGLRGAPAAAA